jgi:type II restriction enzyme
MIKKFTGNKSPKLQSLYQDMLVILDCIGIPIEDLTDRAKEKMVGACLAVGNVKKVLGDITCLPKEKALKTRDIINFENEHFGESISPGSYDDIRRKDLLRLKEANVVLSSSSFDKQATNDPSRGYVLNPLFVELVSHYGKKDWGEALSKYQIENNSLKEELARKRNLEKIPVKLPNGVMLSLSAGEHNDLQKAIIEQFLPLFGFGAEVLYIGDSSDKYLFVEKERLDQIHFFEIGHEELPDVIAYSSKKNLLYLVEAVHSAGPMSEIRINKLKKNLKDSGCTARIVFFTAFLNKKTFRKWCEQIAWETETWIAENPEHLIHFNGHKFLDLYK